MKKVTPFFIVVLTILLLTACGSATPTATQALVQPAATEAPAEPAATEPVPITGGTQVDITLADNTIETNMTSFQVGVPYTLLITNTGQRAHNFNINPPVAVAGSIDQALDSALLVVPQEQLAPGQTATVEFTFPVPASTSIYSNPLAVFIISSSQLI